MVATAIQVGNAAFAGGEEDEGSDPSTQGLTPQGAPAMMMASAASNGGNKLLRQTVERLLKGKQKAPGIPKSTPAAKAQGGVYALLENGKIVYVGRTKNLVARAHQHKESGLQFKTLFEANRYKQLQV